MSLHMDSSASALFLPSQLELQGDQSDYGVSSVDSSFLRTFKNIPVEFTWPKEDTVTSIGELMEPLVDLEGFFRGDEVATQQAARIIKAACLSHGFFQVINHGVDSRLLSAVHDHVDHFFKLPTSQKLRARRMPGNLWGYSGAHAERFSSKLPWKETFSFGFDYNSKDPMVVSFFKSTIGKDFEQTGLVYQKYCEAMKGLSLTMMELLAISLGIDRFHYKKFFEDGCSIMRCNYYPPCQEPALALGTGPHCDPTSLTILHQDQVGGLEVFANNRWLTVRPHRDALVINIGDTFMDKIEFVPRRPICDNSSILNNFMSKVGKFLSLWELCNAFVAGIMISKGHDALSNGKYKSCLHRAVVNRYKERVSLAFFLCPREDKVVRAPSELLGSQGTRMYPDFTWSDLLEFTQNHYRADTATLQNFTKWLLSSKPDKI